MTLPDPALPAAAPHNPLVPRVAPLRGLGIAAIALIAAACLVDIAYVWSDWYGYGLARDYVAGKPGVLVADLDRADSIALVLAVLYASFVAAAGIVFIVWLYRARTNAELINGAEHRRGRGWVIGGWFCPIVNLWFPHQVVQDVWRTSDPAAPADLYTVAGLRPSPLVRWWWAALLSAFVIERMWYKLSDDEADPIGWLKRSAVVDMVTTALSCAAAVLVALIIRRIGEWQAIPRPPREDWRRA